MLTFSRVIAARRRARRPARPRRIGRARASCRRRVPRLRDDADATPLRLRRECHPDARGSRRIAEPQIMAVSTDRWSSARLGRDAHRVDDHDVDVAARARCSPRDRRATSTRCPRATRGAALRRARAPGRRRRPRCARPSSRPRGTAAPRARAPTPGSAVPERAMPGRSSASCLSAARLASRCHVERLVDDRVRVPRGRRRHGEHRRGTLTMTRNGDRCGVTMSSPPTTRIDSTADDITPASTSEIHVQYGATERISMPITSGPKSS